MKLLLCSQGITNKSIENKFFEMVGKKPEEIHLVYIPTAVFPITSELHKKWMIDNLRQLDNMKIGTIDILDFSSLPREKWLSRIKCADVIFVEGGAVIHLHTEAIKAGIDKILKDFLRDGVYVGCSGGSTMLGEKIIASSGNVPGYKAIDGFGFYNFSIRPHYNRSDRAQFTDEVIQQLAKEFNTTFYAIDDDSAIAVVGDKVEVISEGRWERFE